MKEERRKESSLILLFFCELGLLLELLASNLEASRRKRAFERSF